MRTRALPALAVVLALLHAPAAAAAGDGNALDVKSSGTDAYLEKGVLTFVVAARDDNGPVENLDKGTWALSWKDHPVDAQAVAQTFRAAGLSSSVLVILAATGTFIGAEESDVQKARGPTPVQFALEGLSTLKTALAPQDSLTVGCYDEGKAGFDSLLPTTPVSKATRELTVDAVRAKCRSGDVQSGQPRLMTSLKGAIQGWLSKAKGQAPQRFVVVIVTDGASREEVEPDWIGRLAAQVASRGWIELYVVGLEEVAFENDKARMQALAKGWTLSMTDRRQGLPEEIGKLGPAVGGAGLYQVAYTVQDSVKGQAVAVLLGAKDARGTEYRSDAVALGALQRKSSWLKIAILVASILVGAVLLFLVLRWVVQTVAERRRRRAAEDAKHREDHYEGPSRGRLIVRSGPAEGTTFHLVDDLSYIGRSADNHVCLPDPSVSKRHCSIRITNKTYQLEDLQSMAGVMLNGQKVVKVFLKDGDAIRLGSSEMQFKLQ